MTTARRQNFIAAAIVVAFVLVAWACPFVSYGAELRVGTTQPYLTLPAAVSAARPGDVVTLVDDATTVAGETGLNKPNLTIRSLSGHAVVRCTVPDSRFGPDATQLFRITAPGVTLDGLTLAVANGKAVAVDGAADVTLRNLRFDGANTVATWTENGLAKSAVCGGYWAIQATGTTRLTLDNITFGLHSSYLMLLDGTPNRDVRITRVTTTNSVFQHPLRTLNVNGVTIDHCALLAPLSGPGYKHVGGFSGRGGSKNITITNSDVERGGFGAQNADEVTVENVRLENCRILNGYAVYRIAGLWINGKVIVPPATQPSTRPADVAKALATEIKVGLPADKAAKVDQLAGMVH